MSSLPQIISFLNFHYYVPELPGFEKWLILYRVFHSTLIYFKRLDGHQICKLNLVWRLPWETEMRPFMKIWGKYLLIKQFQRYDYFFTVHSALFYSRVDYEFEMFVTAKKSHLWNHLSEKDLPYIFMNGRISAFQGNFQTKSNVHISWPFSLPKYIKPLWKTLYLLGMGFHAGVVLGLSFYLLFKSTWTYFVAKWVHLS